MNPGPQAPLYPKPLGQIVSTTWVKAGESVILCGVTVPVQRVDSLMVTNVAFGVRPRFKYWLGNSGCMTLRGCLVTQSCPTLCDAMDGL